jgi:chromosomal replication initiation ATPase DnaA
MTHLDQLAFSFPYHPDYAGDAFIEAPCNAAALAWLDRTPEWPDGRLALWGEAGCGKTHLLHRWAKQVEAAWLHGSALHGLPDAPTGPLAIDDADAAAEEIALFHLLNAAAEAGMPVLLTGREAPARWPVRLPDLASRLRAITAVRIAPPDDMLLRILLGRLLSDRRVPVPEPVQDWMLRRLPRQAGAMRRAAALLDNAQLVAQRTVTRPLAETFLAPLLGGSDEISRPGPAEPASGPPIASRLP